MSAPKNVREALAAAWPAHRERVLGALVASLTLGLAPFYPHAHIWKQLVNVWRGTLTEPIDVFDLVLHGAPWVALFVTTGLLVRGALRARGAEAAGNGASADVSAR